MGELSLDKLDKEILSILLKNANTPYTDIAKKLGVSGGTIHVRMKKMQDAGIVSGSKLIVNTGLLGYDICAFLGVYLEKGSAYTHALQELEKIPEIVELHYITGSYNMLAKILCRDTAHLRSVLNSKIQIIDGIERTESFISLETGINREIDLTTLLV